MDARPRSGDAGGSGGRRGSYGFGAICRYWAPQIGEPPTAGTGVVADGSEAQTHRQQGRGSARGRHAVRATLPAGDALRVASPPPLPPGAGDASCIVLAEARALCELFVDAGGTGWHRSDGWHQLRTHLEAAEAPTVGDGAGVAGNNDAGPTHLWLHGPAQLPYGVAVDADGHVTALDLSGNNLAGRLPAALGQLSALRRLCVDGNRLVGAVPDEIGRCSALRVLWLTSNRLCGPLPRSLQRLTRLESLSVAGNARLERADRRVRFDRTHWSGAFDA